MLNRNIVVALVLAWACPSEAQQVHETVGWRPTAVPLLNFNSDDGMGYGCGSISSNTTVRAYPIAANTVPRYLFQPRASGYTACSWIRLNFGPSSGSRPNWFTRRRNSPITTAASATRISRIFAGTEDVPTSFSGVQGQVDPHPAHPLAPASRGAFKPLRY